MAKRFFIRKCLVVGGVVLMGYASAMGQASAQPIVAPSNRPLNVTPRPPKKVPGVQLKATPKAPVSKLRLTPTPKALTDATIPTAPTTSSYTSEVLSNGATAYTVAASQFAITLPKGWQALDLDSKALAAALDTVTQDNPEFGSVLTGQMQQLVAQGIKFYAMDLSGKPASGQLPTTLNVLIQKLPGTVPMKSLISLTAQQIETIFSLDVPVEQAVLKMSVGEVGFLRYVIPINLPNGKKVSVTATQYLVQGQAGLYIVSFSALPSVAKAKAKTFEAAMKTFAFLK